MSSQKNKKIKFVCISLLGILLCLLAIGKTYQYANMQAKYFFHENGDIAGFTYQGESYVDVLDFEQDLTASYGIYGSETSRVDQSKKIFLYQSEKKIKDIFTYCPLYGYYNDPHHFFWMNPGPGRDVVYVKRPQRLPSMMHDRIFKMEFRGDRWYSIEDATQINELIQSLASNGNLPPDPFGVELSGMRYTLIAYYSDYPVWEMIGTWDGSHFHFA